MFNALMRVLPTGLTNTLTATYFTVRKWGAVGFRGEHSLPQTISNPAMKVHILPALEDNYMYLIIDEVTKEAAIVDPVDPDKVIRMVKSEGVTLTTVLTTHHHWDHAGGNAELVGKVANLAVYGGDDRIDALTNKVGQDDEFKIGELSVRCLFTPCHTVGHICYLVTGATGPPAVFTGDTLFVAGCGRFFEGKPEQMYSALVEKLGKLSDETLVFCGHEYTVANLKFAQFVEPSNESVAELATAAARQRAAGQVTVPSTIGQEKLVNPFMRVDEPGVRAHANAANGIAAMAAIRREKDNFKAKMIRMEV